MISFRTQDGLVLRRFSDPGSREISMNSVEAQLLLTQLRRSASLSDWWAPFAQVMAADLQACIREVQQQTEAA